VPAAAVAPEPPVKKFKEKTVTSLEGECSVPGTFFKKRKIAGRSARQRNDDD
jgi:WW domain-binding protein 4